MAAWGSAGMFGRRPYGAYGFHQKTVALKEATPIPMNKLHGPEHADFDCSLSLRPRPSADEFLSCIKREPTILRAPVDLGG